MNKARSDIIQIYEAAVAASLPGPAVQKYLPGYTDDLQKAGRFVIVAIGKAANDMAQSAVEYCKAENIAIDRTFVVVPEGSAVTVSTKDIYFGGHPLPNQDSIRAAEDVSHYIAGLSKNDVVLLLLSGGGSALFELPVSELTLPKLQDWYKKLIDSGYTIQQINKERQRRSLVKGGKLARMTKASMIQLILSDVIGDKPFEMVASGPGYAPELANNKAMMIGSASLAVKAAFDEAARLGYEPVIVDDSIAGDVADVSRTMVDLCCDIAKQDRDQKVALLAAGEPTIRLTGKGKGGRNMHLALSVAAKISRYPGVTFASLGTDGRDGPTDAAGGIVDSTSRGKLSKMAMNIKQILDDCDSYHALDEIDALYKRGYTGTNVNDLMIGLISKPV